MYELLLAVARLDSKFIITKKVLQQVQSSLVHLKIIRDNLEKSMDLKELRLKSFVVEDGHNIEGSRITELMEVLMTMDSETVELRLIHTCLIKCLFYP